ncbi:mucin TcMUCII [Trypanosoma cruzi]|nr:mucin TcMUCII [Trypanosoma cruzi]
MNAMTTVVTVRRRVVCAVLVIALLCCCSFVCVTATGEDNDDNSSPPSPKARTPDHTKNALGALQPDAEEAGGSQRDSGRNREEGLRRQGPSLPAEAGTAITGQTRVSPEKMSSANDNPEPRGLATQSPHTQDATGVSDAQNKKAQENTQGDENHKAQVSNQKIKISNVNTTTTEAPTTTTTTTTTTTAAPEAPSTTTTETPTTTTTRAPSRLREIDGSLSSSAWVCAPLLLAVSALAYTTLG